MKINIARIYYPVTTLGPGKRVGIWLCGCPFNCEDCISSELKDINIGKEISINEIVNWVCSLGDKVEGITISGGEPFYQFEELLGLLKRLNDFFQDIIVFTGYRYEELIFGEKKRCSEAFKYISLLIDGRFEKNKICSCGLRGSSNQRIIKFKDIYLNIDFYKMEKRIQVVYFNDNFLEIGIPGGNIW